MKRVYSTYDLVAAHHARNLLEAEGIRAVVKNELLSSAMGELPPIECQVEVWVLRGADAERATTLLRHGRSVPATSPWRCPACGEPAEPQFTQCWRCGAYRPASDPAKD
ncbi:MAG TPA: DUF2007 domain-containing protein [Burkholderiales bacterium]|nr:DUF2007 domain-containing protein [Burkholderiales bacterium]